MIKTTIILALWLGTLAMGDNRPTALTPSGRVIGSTMQSRRGRPIYAFRGIPFAQPPVGNLRFKAPRPITQYPQTINATEESMACPQPTELPHLVSEDCLLLNVYTPTQPGKRASLLPVIVYFHPGGFYAGSGQSFIAGPQYLLDKDVLLVSVNYRLGSLGFLSTGDCEAPGNNGLKDQVVALRWIQRNIASFGGDPNSVTILGYSAGAISVALHMLSPMSKGLFHRVISMSGAPTANWEVPRDQIELARKQAEVLQCDNARTTETILECLHTKTYKELGDSLLRFYEFDWDPILIWKPVIEPECTAERFLHDTPERIIQSGNFTKVPLIVGMTEFEFTQRAFAVLANDTLRTEMDQSWARIAPIAFVYERDTTRSHTISSTLRQAYLNEGTLQNDNETALALGSLYGDGLISFGVHRFAQLMAEKNSADVFYYLFKYRGRYSHFYLPGTQTPLGAVHHDDLLYLFNVSLIFPPTTLQDPESKMVDTLTQMWTNFAKEGNPTPASSSLPNNIHWNAIKPKDAVYLEIDDELCMKRDLYVNRFSEFDWDPILIWKPVIEPECTAERFLHDKPDRIIQSGNFTKVPLIVGMTEFEFTQRAFAVLANDTLRTEMDQSWARIAPIAFVYERDTTRSHTISSTLRQAYLNEGTLQNDNETALALGSLYGDGLISFGVHRFAQLMAEKNSADVFYYLFKYRGRYSHFYLPGTQTPLGAVHHDDLLYLFNVSLIFPPTTLQDPESKMVDTLTQMWTNFAKEGNPTPASSSLPNNIHWNAITPKDAVYLEIDDELCMKRDLYVNRFSVWDSLFPL